MFLLCSSPGNERRKQDMFERRLDREGVLVLAVGWIVALMVTLT
jgi:hypothetical protein